jgi:diacylglycerol kinase family enzyme
LSISSRAFHLQFKDLYLLVFGNGEFFGGGMRVCPDARIDDGQANVVILHEIDRLYIFTQLSTEMVSGQHIVREKKCVNFKTIDLMVESSDAIEIELDGDLIGVGPAKFSILPSTVKVYRLYQ